MLEYQPRYEEEGDHDEPSTGQHDHTFAEQSRRRMLQWPNPVEYVNNMYGCHPGEEDTEYFRKVFGE